MQSSSTVITVRRGLLRGILTLRREGQWVTAMGALFGVLLLVQILGLLLLGLQGMQTVLRHRTDLRLELQDTATDRSIQEFYSALTAEPYVEQALLVTKEKAYDQMRTTEPDLIAFLEEFHLENPFADTIAVTLKNLDDYKAFASFAENARWKEIVNPTFLSEVTGQEKQVYALLSVTQAGRALTGIILAITAAALVFIVTELTRRRALARSDEVLVERLVGATTLSILLPFATEATVLFLLSILGSALVLFVFIVLLPLLVPGMGPSGALSELRNAVSPLLYSVLPVYIAIELIAAPFVATLGAWLGIRPQVESPRIAYAM